MCVRATLDTPSPCTHSYAFGYPPPPPHHCVRTLWMPPNLSITSASCTNRKNIIKSKLHLVADYFKTKSL